MKKASIAAGISPEVERLKEYLDNRGIMYSWLTAQIEATPSWLTYLFQGRYGLSPEKQKLIEDALNIQLSEPVNSN